MTIQHNTSLQLFHTFGMDVRARYLASFQSVEMLQEILQTNEARDTELKVLGGGSNILFTKDVDALVL